MSDSLAVIRSADAIEFAGRETTTVISPSSLQVRSVRSPQLPPMRLTRYDST